MIPREQIVKIQCASIYFSNLYELLNEKNLNAGALRALAQALNGIPCTMVTLTPQYPEECPSSNAPSCRPGRSITEIIDTLSV